MSTSFSRKSLQRLVAGGLLTALVIILQLIGCIPQISANKLSFVLIPIVLGGAVLGVRYGMWLGFVFGAVVFFGGLSGLDPFTALLININPFGTLAVCLGKGILAGGAAAGLFRLLQKHNKPAAVLAASVAAPLVNTGLYCLGMLTLFRPTLVQDFHLDENAGFLAGFWFIFSLVLVNFAVELAINLALCLPIYTAVSRSRLSRIL